MSDELKPCPFCGSENVKAFAYDYVIDGEPDAYCQCQECSVTGPNGKNEAEAIAAWNRRATPSPSTAPTVEPWAYAMVRYGKVQHIERSAEQAAMWIDAEAVPLIPMWSPSTAPIAEDEREWHAPGMGEVHHRDHTFMIECMREIDDPDQDYIADDDLAKRVCDALNASKPAAREAARQSIDTPELQAREIAYTRALAAGDYGRAIEARHALIAHIDTWGGAKK